MPIWAVERSNAQTALAAGMSDEVSGLRKIVLRHALVVGGERSSPSAQAALRQAGFEVRAVDDVDGAIAAAAELPPALVVLDAASCSTRVVELVRELKAREAVVCLVVIPEATGEQITLAHEAGADGILLEPLNEAALRRWAAHSLARRPTPRASAASLELPSAIVGASAEMREVWRLLLAAANSASSVLVTGETGTGKEVVARALHRFSCRQGGPFVAVNCAALPENLLESELFGHERGSFTGATAQHKGRFELADTGTLFLDEIGDLPPSLQVKLLRVLQERSFERVGGTQTISVDVRVVAATHRDLEREIAAGRFRADLFYRLNVLCIRIPPLRARPRDVLLLWEHCVRQGAEREGRPAPQTSVAARRMLLRHGWPGNVRELQNVVENVLALTNGASVEPADLPDALRAEDRATDTARGLLGRTLHEVESLIIRESYEAFGTVRATAEILGISPRKIHYRLREFRASAAKGLDASEVGSGPESTAHGVPAAATVARERGG